MHSSISQRYSPRAEADLGQGEAAARLIGLIGMWLVILPVVPVYGWRGLGQSGSEAPPGQKGLSTLAIGIGFRGSRLGAELGRAPSAPGKMQISRGLRFAHSTSRIMDLFINDTGGRWPAGPTAR